MNTESIIYILMAVNFGVLMLNALFWILVSLSDRKIRKREEEMYQRLNQTLEKANNQAAEIMLKANEKSTEMLANTEIMVEDIKIEMRRSFSAAKDKNLELLEKYLSTILTDNKQFITELKNSIASTTSSELARITEETKNQITEFVNRIKEQTVNAQSEIEGKLELEYQKTLDEIEAYKNKRFRQIDSGIGKIVSEILSDYLQEGVSIDEHEKLIKESLLKAKKDGVFAELINT